MGSRPAPAPTCPHSSLESPFLLTLRMGRAIGAVPAARDGGLWAGSDAHTAEAPVVLAWTEGSWGDPQVSSLMGCSCWPFSGLGWSPLSCGHPVCPVDRPAGRAQTPRLPTSASPAVLCDWAVSHRAEILPQVGKASVGATSELAATSTSITPLPLGPHTPGRSRGTVPDRVGAGASDIRGALQPEHPTISAGRRCLVE